MNNIKIFLFSAIVCWGFCANSMAQALKTYSGEYKYGKATYSYQENPNGGRIYEGNFTYRYTSPGLMGGTVTGSATGKFKNNKKEGVWTYTKNNDAIVKATYKEGVLDGLYEYSDIFLKRKVSLSVNLRDGKFIGSAKGTNVDYYWSSSKEIVNFTGQFDENGCMDGKWEFKNVNGRYIYIAYYEHGSRTSYFHKDLTTGDTEQGKGNITSFLNETIIHNYDRFENMVDRNNKKWQWCNIEENKYNAN